MANIQGTVFILFLVGVHFSIAHQLDVEMIMTTFNSLKLEIAQLKTTVNTLESKDEVQTYKISQLEEELSMLRELTSELQKGKMQSQSDILKSTEASFLGQEIPIPDPLIQETGEQRHHGAQEESAHIKETRSKMKYVRRSAEPNTQIAFSATITPHDYGPLGQGQVVQFDHVLSNLGNAYHPQSGTFIAPVDGHYVISATISGWRHSIDHVYLEIKVNGSMQCKMWALSSDQSTQLLVLHLRTNDEVHVTNNRATDVILGDFYSSFSGFLLYPTDGFNAIIGK